VLLYGSVRCFRYIEKTGGIASEIYGLEEGYLTGTNVDVRRYRTLRYFQKTDCMASEMDSFYKRESRWYRRCSAVVPGASLHRKDGMASEIGGV
jgi:hypothetical protein